MPHNVLGRGAPPPQPQQLPPQMFTTAAQLLDLTDSRSPSKPCTPPPRVAVSDIARVLLQRSSLSSSATAGSLPVYYEAGTSLVGLVRH